MSTKGSCDFSKSDILSRLSGTGPCVGVVAEERRQGALLLLCSTQKCQHRWRAASENTFPSMTEPVFFVSVLLFKDGYPVSR